MKKILLILAVVFTTSAFASVKTINKKTLDLDVKEKVEVTYNFNKEFKECEIKIKGTYDGKEIDVTVTVEADNCAAAAGALLKSFAKE